jgi:hypothetical protein
MCINQFFLKDNTKNQYLCPVCSDPELSQYKINKYNETEFRIYDSISLDREIILNNLDNIPLKTIFHPLIYNNLWINPF